MLYVPGGEAYVPMIALCQMLGLRVDTHVQQWRKLLLDEEVRKLPVRTHGRRKRALWCINMEVLPFLYSYFDWALVSQERRVQLRQAAHEWLELAGQGHRTMQDRYKGTRDALFSILTTHADAETTLKDYAQRLHAFLDARSLPLLPVMPEKDNEQLLESMTQLVQWYEDFAAFLEEFFASEPE